MVCMIALFQNMVALSLQIGVLIGIVLLFSRSMKKSYQIVGRYLVWLVLALRLLIPVNMGWFQLEDFQGISKEVLSEKQVEPSTYAELPEGNLHSSVSNKAQADKMPKNLLEKEEQEQALSFVEQEKIQNAPNEQLQKGNNIEQKISTNQKFNAVVKWYQKHKDILWNGAFVLWVIGVCAMAGYELLMYQSTYRSIRRWQRSVPKEYILEMEKVKREMNISKEIPVYQCRNVFSPMIVGLRNPAIFLPEKSYDRKSLYFIYKHELTHYCHGDLYYKCVQTITRCVYWFHPLVHSMYRQAAFDVELFCDERVTKNKSRTFCQQYSFVLLNTLTEQNVRTFPLSTCFMNGGKKQMKERFTRIMSEKKTKYGIGIFGILMVCALILGNISFSTTHAEGKDVEVAQEECAGIKHILVIGEENLQNGEFSRADLNLLLTLNTQSKTCYVTDLERDLAVTYQGEKCKLSSLYAKYGIEASKEVVEDMAGISIDGTVVVNFEQFETVIDAMGGLEISLTKKEAKYLNETNYIREQKYRNVTAGTQVLNGQQVLGFVRIRQVESVNGKKSSFGRGERAMEVVAAMRKALKKMNEKQWMETAKTVYDLVKINGLELSTVYGMASEVLSDTYTCKTQQVPEMTKRKDGSWKENFEQGMDENIGSYIEYDFANSKSFANIRGQ